MSPEELAKLSQNPVGNLISVPFQYNGNLNFGPEKGTQSILNIQPVSPISVNSDWNIITRTILPVVWLPSTGAGESSVSGISDLQFTAFLSPANPGECICGVGAIAQAPTHSNGKLGNDNWGLGPSFVVLHIEKGSPWVYGALVNNVWSLGSSSDSPYIQQRAHPAVPQLQPAGWHLPHIEPGHHRRLEGIRQPAMDGADRRRRRAHLSLRQAAGEHADRRVLQRGAA